MALAQGGLSSERGKPSASSRVQELISRYNLNNLKLNLHSKDHSQSIGAIKKSGKFNMHLEGTMNYSIAPLNGPEKAMQPNTSKHELLVAMQNTEQVILKNQQNVINAIRNAKIRKTRNSNSKSIVSPAPPMEESSPVVAILAQRISNNKTTVEPGDLQGSIVRKNISPLKNSGLVLPSIDSNKFTLMPSYNDPQNMQTAQVSP